MICTIITDISRVKGSLCRENMKYNLYFRYFEDESIIDKKRDSIASYITLNYFYKKFFGRDMPTVRKRKNRKPRFTLKWEMEPIIGYFVPDPWDKSPVVDFNISHSGDVAVISMMWDEPEGASIGVDVQRTVLKRIEENVMGSALAEVDFSEYKALDNVEHRFFFATLAKDGDLMYYKEIDMARGVLTDDIRRITYPDKDGTLVDTPLRFQRKRDSAAEDFYVGWTVVEATLKATGRGFAEYKNLAKHLSESRLVSCNFSLGEDEYYISVCQGKLIEDIEDEHHFWDAPARGHFDPYFDEDGKYHPPIPIPGYFPDEMPDDFFYIGT